MRTTERKATDERLMGRAIRLSRKGFPAPNPHVGCVIALGDQVVGEGYHAFRGGPHAEVVALNMAGPKAQGATAYVTLEPCNHYGSTPPCTDALLAAGIARVVAACSDSVPGHSGGLARLQSAGIVTELGLLSAEATEANLMWLTAVERKRPFVVAKAAITLDGRISTAHGESRWITGDDARKEAHRLRAECGAVLVGRATAELDNPHLTARGIKVANQPLRIVLDPKRKLPDELNLFNGEAPTLRVMDGKAGPNEISVPYGPNGFDVDKLLKILFERGVTSLLVEGGASTLGSFLGAAVIDRFEIFVAGKVFGAGKSWIELATPPRLERAPKLEFKAVRRIGSDLRITAVPE